VTGTVPLGWVGLSGHQHQSASCSVSQASTLFHHPAAGVAARPKLSTDLVSLPNSPIHSGAMPSVRMYPPARCIWPKYADLG
jgi:hypothetical protein